MKSLTQQNIRNANAAVTVYQTSGGQAIHLIGSPKPRQAQLPRQVQANQAKTTALTNQLVTVAKTVTTNQFILSGSKQVLTPIMGKLNFVIIFRFLRHSTLFKIWLLREPLI